MTDTLANINNRAKTLRDSYRGKNGKGIEIIIEKAEETAEKYKKPPHDGSYRSGGYNPGPKIVR